MEFVTAQTYLGDILHIIGMALLVPVVIILIVLIGYALFCIGSVLVEFFTERRNFKVAMPAFLAALMSAEQDEIPAVIRDSGLLNRQKIALLTVFDYRTLPGEALVALMKRLVAEQDNRLARITGRNATVAKIAPMVGLMGTLIPLGPGIAALGQGDIVSLSSSIVIAFDTTVAGLATAAVCLVIAKIRRNWYEDYMGALESSMATMLEKIEAMRADGLIETSEPSDYAFMYESSLFRKGKEALGAAAASEAEQAAADIAPQQEAE